MKIFCISLPIHIPSDQFDYLMSIVSFERQEKTLRYLKKADQYRSLIGEALVRHIVGGKADIIIDTYGKPVLKGNDNLHFNISHSGAWIIAGFSTVATGIDVEEHRNTETIDFYDFFHQDEVNWLISQAEATRQSDFFALWTLKESYIKAVGKGMYMDLNSFSVIPSVEGIKFTDDANTDDVYFGLKELDTEHTLSWCTLGQKAQPTIVKWTFNEFYNRLIN